MKRQELPVLYRVPIPSGGLLQVGTLGKALAKPEGACLLMAEIELIHWQQRFFFATLNQTLSTHTSLMTPLTEELSSDSKIGNSVGGTRLN